MSAEQDLDETALAVLAVSETPAPGNPEVDPATPVDPQALADRLGWLAEKAMADGWFAPRILPQLHVLIWGNKRGV